MSTLYTVAHPIGLWAFPDYESAIAFLDESDGLGQFDLNEAGTLKSRAVLTHPPVLSFEPKDARGLPDRARAAGASIVEVDGAPVEFRPVDYKGRTFDRFFARRDSHLAPGWFVFGRNPDYGDRLVSLCARPAIEPRRHRSYNGKVRAGWRTKAEAESIARKLTFLSEHERLHASFEASLTR